MWINPHLNSLQEDNAFFITTNALVTKNQTQGKCAEVKFLCIQLILLNLHIKDDHAVGAKCKVDSDCVQNEPILLGNGKRFKWDLDFDFNILW